MCEGNSAKVPREVSYYYLCKEFKCLPGSGGLLEQDPHLVEAFMLCMATEGEYQRFQEKVEEQKRKHQEKLAQHRNQQQP